MEDKNFPLTANPLAQKTACRVDHKQRNTALPPGKRFCLETARKLTTLQQNILCIKT